LTVPNERALVRIADDLRLAGVRFVAVFEPDADDALMAIGLEPARKESLRKHLSKLPLLK
jgi:hypothetical protein